MPVIQIRVVIQVPQEKEKEFPAIIEFILRVIMRKFPVFQTVTFVSPATVTITKMDDNVN